MSKPWPLDLQLPVREHHSAGLRPVPANIPARFAGRACAGNFRGAQHQHGLDRLSAYNPDHLVDGDPGLGDQFY